MFVAAAARPVSQTRLVIMKKTQLLRRNQKGLTPGSFGTNVNGTRQKQGKKNWF